MTFRLAAWDGVRRKLGKQGPVTVCLVDSDSGGHGGTSLVKVWEGERNESFSYATLSDDRLVTFGYLALIYIEQFPFQQQ